MRLAALLLPALLLPLYFLLAQGAWESRAEVRRQEPAGYVLPSRFSRILACGNRGLLSDYLFLKGMTFAGGRSMYGEPMSEADWRFFTAILETVTDLDPYFLDPYVLAEGLLTWDAGLIAEANRILEKGRQYKKDEWRIPFYIGFNYFYFLQDYARGAEYVMEASRIPGSPPYLTLLAGRLNYYGGKSKTGLLFLKEILAENPDPRMRAQMEKWIVALERASFLEEQMEKYREERGQAPMSLDALVTAGLIERLPEEPFGGEWIILKSGRVFSTSRFAVSESKN